MWREASTGVVTTDLKKRHGSSTRWQTRLWYLALLGGLAMSAGCGSTATAPTAVGSEVAESESESESEGTEQAADAEASDDDASTEADSENDAETELDAEGEVISPTATPSGLPLPDVAEGELLFAGSYGANDCVETTFVGTRQSTLGVDCQGPRLPYWFTDAGELIVDMTAMNDEMLIRLTQELQWENTSSPVVIEWNKSAGISRQYLAIANLDDVVRIEDPYFIAVIDVCQWDVQYTRQAEGASLVIEYGLPNYLRYQLNVLPNSRFPSRDAEGFEAPAALQEYVAGRSAACPS